MEESFAMNGGDGPNSYTQNSKLQTEALNQAKVLLIDSIQEKLILQSNSDGADIFRIADLGCSVGPNTFACVETIVEAVKLKFKKHGLESAVPEFQVFFNDHVANDFNTLFKALPSTRQYMVAGVPGSFHGRIVPRSSMNFMHSASSLHWLSKIPEEVTRKDSLAWSKGITYVGGSDEVVKAYTAQFLKDMEAFLKARMAEQVEDGLLAILMPCRPEGTLPSESIIMQAFDCLGYAIMDMAKEGLVDEALVDSFNMPIYIPTASEVKEIVLSFQDCLSIEKMEIFYYPTKLSTPEDVRISSLNVRATVEGILSKHFGSEIMDELFERYTEKIEEFRKTPNFLATKKAENLFVLVRRNAISTKPKNCIT